MEIILASKSPRRREILNAIGIKNFSVIPAEGDECSPEGAGPGETVCCIAAGKAREVAKNHKNALIIAADTIVYLDGCVLGKPCDDGDARRMLRMLSGREHEVYTGVHIIFKDRELSAAERTLVRFRSLDDSEIDTYIATGEPADKAGAYGIQGHGAILAEAITGDFFNVMGLPACRLYLMMKELGIDFRQVI